MKSRDFETIENIDEENKKELIKSNIWSITWSVC